MTATGRSSPGRFRLLLITDRRATRRPLAETVAAAVDGGVTAVMVRAPDADAEELLSMTLDLEPSVRGGGALLLVNDMVDVAIAAGADGVHLKRTSVNVAEARRQLGPDRVVGVSTHAPEEVESAFEDGADYVVFGPVFPTPSKTGIFDPRGPELYHRVVRAAPGPVLALGGIDLDSLDRLAGGPVPGVAAIRALQDVPDPASAARRMRERLATMATEER